MDFNNNNFNQYNNFEQQGYNNQIPINNIQQNNIQPSYNSQMHDMMMSNFRPLIPITVNKDYITIMCILSAILLMLENSEGIANGFSFISVCVLIAYNIYSIAKIKRCGYKLTMSGCLLTDMIVFLVCCSIFIFVSKWDIFNTVVKIAWWCVKCVIAQVITHLILDSDDKRKIKKLKNMQKQRNQYERKIDKIYGKQNNNK